MSLPMASHPPSHADRARFVHENGTQLRLQCFLVLRDAQERVATVKIQGIDGWCLPGEAMLVNESPDEAAIRVAESWFETKIGMSLERVLSFPATGGEDDRWYLIFVYAAEAPAKLKGTSDTIAIEFHGKADAPMPFAMSHQDVWNALW